MINSMDYCTIVSDKRMKDSGLFRGDTVLVTGVKAAPISKNDLYLQRIFVHVVKVEKDGTHLLPLETNDYKVYLVDPRNLQKVDEETTERLQDALKRQYGQE